MKILSARVENFGSYKELDIDFTNQGLTLVSGPTGSGKSTLCDIIPWILFGRTAKDGAVDEIRPWNCVDMTYGEILIRLNTGAIRVARTRNPNDLCFAIGPILPWSRGKDLNDTQKLINNLLGIDLESYLLSSYFHEFSSISHFFTTTAKNRRQITEQIVDLSLAKKLQESASEYKKKLNQEVTKLTGDLVSLDAILKDTELNSTKIVKMQDSWNLNQVHRIIKVNEAIETFEADKKKRLDTILVSYTKEQMDLLHEKTSLELSVLPVEVLKHIELGLQHRKEALKDTTCPTCGTHLDNSARMVLMKQEAQFTRDVQQNDLLQIQLVKINKKIALHETTLQPRLDQENNRQNDTLEHLEQLQTENNPYTYQLWELYKRTDKLVYELAELQQDLNLANEELSDLKLLTKVVDDFRAALITNTLQQVEANTNNLLAKHFDAEIKVKFSAEDADKVEVEVYKDGNLASFTQLSKGQRQLLKLTFAVSIMKATSDLRGVSLNTLFFDEATEGLDETMKLKAYGLFQDLATNHESVFVVEHSPGLKELFTNQVNITLVDGQSKIT